MAVRIELKYNSTPGKIPTVDQLALGELALNTHDGKVFMKKDDGTESIIEIGSGSGGGPSVSASYATYAATAGYATTAGSATTATSASYATTAGTAGTATNATSASYASTASYVLNAISSSYALSASWAPSAATSSYASSSISASYAATASNLIGGTTNYVPLWSSDTTLTSSLMYQSGSDIGIGVTSLTPASYSLEATGAIRSGWGLHVGPMPMNYAPARINISSFTTKTNFANSVMTLSSTETGPGTFPTQLIFAQEAPAGSPAGWSIQSVNQGVAFIPLILQPNGSNVLIGTKTNSAYMLDVAGTLRTTTGVNLATTSGNVAIGKTTSNATFDVNGNAIVTGSLTVTNGITGSLFGTSSWAVSASWAPIPSTASYAATASIAVSASYALTASNILGGTTNYIPLWSSNTILTSSVIYQTNNNILVGTTSDGGYKLDVNGTTRVQSHLDVPTGRGYFSNAMTTNTYGVRIYPDWASSYYAAGPYDALLIDASNSSQFGLYNGKNYTLFKISGSGNSGLPYMSIDGGGQFKLNNDLYILNNAVTSSWNSGYSLIDVNMPVLSIYQVNDTDAISVHGTSLANYGSVYGAHLRLLRLQGYTGEVAVSAAGNLGVGVLNPLYRLHVSGSTNITGSVTINNGSVTMPQRPAFRVTGTSSSNISSTTLSGSNVSVDYNQGNYYTASSGVFTAPIAGLYHVFMNLRCGSINASQQAIMWKNNTTSSLMWEAAGNTGATHFGVSGILNLAVNDTLKVDVVVGSINFDGNDNYGAAYIG